MTSMKTELISKPARVHVNAWLDKGPRYILFNEGDEEPHGIADEKMHLIWSAAPELLEALQALAKVQYDGTVEGLRYQIEREDWGDVLNPAETAAAYELTIAAINKALGEQAHVS